MKKIFYIEGMSCGHCIIAVEKELNKLNVGKKKVKIGKAMVEFDITEVSEEDIKIAIKDVGYTVIE